MIKCLYNTAWSSYQTLTDAFSLSVDNKEKQEMISVVGGGGKTTLIRHLQAEWIKRDILHAVTTTTHLEYVRNGSFLEEESLESFFRVFEKEHTVWLGVPAKKDKMRGMSEAFLYELYNRGVSLLIEADGSRRHPVKMPADHEPVILSGSTHVFAVYGLSGLHKRIADAGFRAEQLARFLGKSEEDYLEEADYIRLAVDSLAGRKQVPDTAKYQVVLNQLDVIQKEKQNGILQMAEELHRLGSIPVLVTGDLKMEPLTEEQ